MLCTTPCGRRNVRRIDVLPVSRTVSSILRYNRVQVTEILVGLCSACDGGLVAIGGCNCASPADVSVGYMHERLCGFEPCPNGCWDKLHPVAEPA